jgi:hypothetical protein
MVNVCALDRPLEVKQRGIMVRVLHPAPPEEALADAIAMLPSACSEGWRWSGNGQGHVQSLVASRCSARVFVHVWTAGPRVGTA